jgi:ABC-type sugar transport system permease subunit
MQKGEGPREIKHTEVMIYIVIIWQFLISVTGLTLLYLLFYQDLLSTIQPWLRVIVILLLMLLTAGNLFSSIHLIKKHGKGRTASLAVNYLGFILAFIILLQNTGVFIGVDALADTFGSGIGWLLGVLVGYLIFAVGDRYHYRPLIEEIIKRIGKIIALAFFVIFLLKVGLIKGIIFLGGQLIIPKNLLIALLMILFGVAFWMMWRAPAGIYLRQKGTEIEALEGFLFLSPNLLGFLIFFAFPLLFSLYISMTDWDAFGNYNFIGLANYLEIFHLNLKQLANPTQDFTLVMDGTIFSELSRFVFLGKDYVLGAEDARFWIALKNTLVFGLISVPLSVIPALLLANILNSKIPGMKIFRSIYFLPSISAVVGISLIWQWLYNATIGYINYFITAGLHVINTIFSTGYPDAQIRWLSESRTALMAIIIVAAWQTMGFNTVLFMAGLQNVPKELYEAATVDGAGRWARFWKITIPLITPTTFFVFTTTTIQALQVFESVFIMTNPPGSPGTSTLTIVLYLYQNGFQRFQQGYGAAIAWVLFVIIFTVTLLQFRYQRRIEAYDM